VVIGKLYFIWGEEAFLIDRKIKEIHSLMQQESGEETELTYLDADELSPRQLLEELEFSPLFALQRMVVIRRPSWLSKSQRKISRHDGILKVMQDYIQRDPGGQTLVITAAEHNGSNPLVKLLDKEAVVHECKPATPQYLSGWIKDEFNARGRKLDAPALSMMAKSGQDMYYLGNLIDKICLAYQNGTIGIKEIEEQLDSREEIKVFKLTDALLERNTAASFRCFYQLLEQGEHPIFMLYMTARQLLSLGKVKHLQERGADNKEIARLTGMKEFAVRKLLGQARNFTWEEIEVLFKKFLEADIKFKSSGQDEKIVMESLIMEICSKK
jgi:DNA polymerase-3 subunit delta